MSAMSTSEEGSAVKIMKLSNGNCDVSTIPEASVIVENETISVTSSFEHFGDIGFKGILNNSVDLKRVVVEGSYKDVPAVIILDKKPFAEDSMRDKLFSEQSKLNLIFQNDIYGSYSCIPAKEVSDIKVTIISPATQKHIEKYSFHPMSFVEETQEIYEKVTVPYLERSSFNIDWVYNVLEHKKEAERIIYEDPDKETGFIMAPDLKWEGKSIEDLYLTAVVHRRNIKSIRDLNQEHLPLLENILNNGTKAIVDKYGVKRSQLRVYLHYQPSYYHLHVHFNLVNNVVGGTFTEKAHLLSTVINNIKLKNSYYQEATLPFVVKDVDPLFKSLVDYGYEF